MCSKLSLRMCFLPDDVSATFSVLSSQGEGNPLKWPFHEWRRISGQRIITLPARSFSPAPLSISSLYYKGNSRFILISYIHILPFICDGTSQWRKARHWSDTNQFSISNMAVSCALRSLPWLRAVNPACCLQYFNFFCPTLVWCKGVEYTVLPKWSIWVSVQKINAQVKFTCRFYDEIGTPLLSDIQVDYSNDSVEQVTQNLFPNYFNGSEIVIAGKLLNRTANNLHVEVTASNSDKYVLLKTDVPIDLSSKNHIRSTHNGTEDPASDRNYVERAWSYLTIKKLLTSWLKSDDTEEREDLRERAKKLALMYNFITPFTTLKIKELALQAEPPMEIYTGPSTESLGVIVQGLQGHRAPLGK